MHRDCISEIYKSFLDNRQLEEELRKNCFDITWLDGKLSTKDILKLESMITSYANRNEEIFFKAGFLYAWDLFEQCKRETNKGKAET